MKRVFKTRVILSKDVSDDIFSDVDDIFTLEMCGAEVSEEIKEAKGNKVKASVNENNKLEEKDGKIYYIVPESQVIGEI